MCIRDRKYCNCKSVYECTKGKCLIIWWIIRKHLCLYWLKEGKLMQLSTKIAESSISRNQTLVYGPKRVINHFQTRNTMNIWQNGLEMNETKLQLAQLCVGSLSQVKAKRLMYFLINYELFLIFGQFELKSGNVYIFF